MERLTERLTEELNCNTVFTIPIGKGIPIAESVVITWVIIGAVLLLSLFLTRNLKVTDPGRRQLVAETLVMKLERFVTDMTGEDGKSYVPYLASVLVFLVISNLAGLFGMKPPTKDLNVTAALAIMSIVLIEFAAVRRKGFRRWLKSFTEPVALVTPFNILEVFIRPLSLCMRLFGNVLGSFIIMELIKMVIPVLVPLPFSFYFDIFDGLIQAYVFVFLTSLFLREAIA
ncbi:MAG: F0F1 ATP synthase subunit A [Clostridium sp.]|jgi:F-type H+-transporting ATPase subunit a|nr:F0F1 ATP synthase subunit A [Clostridium sp.]